MGNSIHIKFVFFCVCVMMVTYDLGEQEISQRQVERDRERRKKQTKNTDGAAGSEVAFFTSLTFYL